MLWSKLTPFWDETVIS